MLISSTAKFHIGLVPQRWYTDSLVIDAGSSFCHEPVISAISGQEFGMIEHITEVDFSHLNTIRGNYIFTEKVCEEMTQKQQYGKGFGIMKKTLNLAIATGKTEEFYEIHLKLATEMEAEITGKINDNNIIEFASTISNPIGVRTKGRKPKDFNHTNTNHKGKKREVVESDQSNKENNIDDEMPHEKFQKILQDNELKNGETSNKRMCGICNKKGHNARTCSKRKITIG